MKIQFYGNKQLLAAFEMGVGLAVTANENKIEITKEIVSRAENILVKEMSTKSLKKFSLDLIPNILASFEPK